MPITEDMYNKNHKVYARFCRSLLTQCRSLRIPMDMVVVAGDALRAEMGHVHLDHLDVWVEGNMFYRFVSAFAENDSGIIDGEFLVKFWSPQGDIYVHGGKWEVNGTPFDGFEETIQIDGFLHWNAEKTFRWVNAKKGVTQCQTSIDGLSENSKTSKLGTRSESATSSKMPESVL